MSVPGFSASEPEPLPLSEPLPWRDQRRERIGKRERLAVRVGQERIGKGQLRVARRLDAEGKHGEAAIGS